LFWEIETDRRIFHHVFEAIAVSPRVDVLRVLQAFEKFHAVLERFLLSFKMLRFQPLNFVALGGFG